MEFDDFKHTHNGKMFGVPVKLDMRCEECPQIDADRWWVPLLEVMHLLFALYCMVMSILSPEFEPVFPVQVGRKVSDDYEGF